MKVEASIVTAEGLVVIPARLRRRFDIRRGTRVSFVEDDGRIVLQPITPEFIRGLRGSLKGERSGLEELLKERRRERAV